MTSRRDSINILMADDDPDDRLMTERAMHEAQLTNNPFFVVDGEELMDYLLHRGTFVNVDQFPTPGLILLDLNMPKKDGREALSEIKTNPLLRNIPVVILTTSRADEDIFSCYDLGANTYIPKPVSFQGLVEAMMAVKSYWFDLARLPNRIHRT